MKTELYYPEIKEDGGYVSVKDYIDAVRKKSERLANRIEAISNHEGNLEVFFNQSSIHYMDFAILNQCFTDLGDNGFNVSVMNMNDQKLNIVGNFTFEYGDRPFAEFDMHDMV
jgi:hypothetical protein